MGRTALAANLRPIGLKIGTILLMMSYCLARFGPKALVSGEFVLRLEVGATPLREKRFMVGKLTIFLFLLLGTIPVAAQPAANPAPAAQPGETSAPVPERRLFDILRDGNKIGTELVEIDKDGNTTNIKFTTHISVVVMYIEVYRFDHSATETWTDGKFVSYKASTDDNGTKHDILANASEDKVDLDIDGKHSEGAPDLIPASWWSRDFVNRTDMLDSETGRLISIKVTDLGDEPLVQNGTTIQAHHYKVSGDVNRDLWFDGDALVRIKLLGSDHSTIVSDLAPESGETH
jgi:hypothetical protein